MNNMNENIAIAALDIGTSQIKLGVFCPVVAPRITILGNIKNKLSYGQNGEVKSSYSETREAAFELFKKLGQYLNENHVDKLYLELCSHVSSLLEWDNDSGLPVEDNFPIWLDNTSKCALDKFNEIMGQSRGKAVIGSFLPPGTNWLLTKLLDYEKKKDFMFLQVGDSIGIVKMGGGSTRNKLWNSIRASVLNKKIAVADEQELAISGLINHIVEKYSFIQFPELNFKIVGPDNKQITIYNKKYEEFINYQKVLLK